MHFLLGMFSFPAPRFHGVELNLLEAHNLAGHAHIAVRPARARQRLVFHFFQRLHLRVVDGVGIVSQSTRFT